MIEMHKAGGCWTLTLNRPEKANALTEPMLFDLAHAAESAQRKAKVLILTGAGGVFCAGADVDEMKTGLADSPVWDRLSGALADFPGFSICALNGSLAGGAFGMALGCDVRLSVQDARFFHPVLNQKTMPRACDIKRLCALIGPSRAKMIMMGGHKLRAEEALSWGLIDRLIDPGSMKAEVRKLSQHAMEADMDHTDTIKGMLD